MKQKKQEEKERRSDGVREGRGRERWRGSVHVCVMYARQIIYYLCIV